MLGFATGLLAPTPKWHFCSICPLLKRVCSVYLKTFLAVELYDLGLCQVSLELRMGSSFCATFKCALMVLE